MSYKKTVSFLTATTLLAVLVPTLPASNAAAEETHESTEPQTMQSLHVKGEPDTIDIANITSETLESYGVSPTTVEHQEASELAEAIDANPVLEAQASKNGKEVEVYHPFENRSLVIRSSSEIPKEASSVEYNKTLDSYIVDFPDEQSAAAAYEEITAKDGIDAAFPDISVKPCSVNYSTYDGWGMSDLNLSTAEYKLDAAADKLKSSVTIAVIDTGLLSSHEIFTNTPILSSSGSIINSKKAFLTSSAFPDNDGHGTHIAGIIAQGTPSSVKLLDIKCYNDKTEGARLSDIYYSLLYAQDKGARVFNISLAAQLGTGASAESSIARGESFLKDVADAGGLIFCAAGNTGTNIDSAGIYPAMSDYAYAVGALDRNYALASYSNYGKSLDFVAPGSSIISSWNTSKTATKTVSGTSMACPHVSSIAANLMIMYPQLSSAEIMTKLKSLCIDLGSAGKDSTFGYGKPVMNLSTIDSVISNPGASSPTTIINGKIKPEATYYSGISKIYKYTGKNICPRPTVKVKIGGIKYKLNFLQDYFLIYANNKQPGTAKVRILLQGKYIGNYYGTFKITK